MTFNPDIHHRRSIRLREYDYSTVGAYFVTVCVNGRECLFGDCVDGDMRVNDAGRMVVEWWLKLPERFPQVSLDEFVIMPNHVHGIVCIIDADVSDTVGAIHELPLHRVPSRQQRRTMLLPKIVGYFKMNTAKHINLMRNNPGVPVWQRNYYERVIRDDNQLAAIREYIANNPVNWAEDEEYSGLMFPTSMISMDT